MNSLPERSRLAVPSPELDTLSFCEATKQSVHQWLSDLPKTDKQQSAQQLSSALDELARIKLAPAQHWPLAELFSSVVYPLTQQIKNQSLDGHILFSETQEDDYKTCLHLLNSLLTVYKAISENSLDSNTQEALPGAALHRAMTISTSILLLHAEFYRPLPLGFWRELYNMYEAAVFSRQLSFKQEDKRTIKGYSLSVANLFKRALLLGQASSNKLSSEEIHQVSKALVLWAPHSKLDKTGANNAHFFIHLGSDTGLQYMLINKASNDKKVLTLDTRLLTAHLRKLKDSITEDKPNSISRNLVSHLASAWGQLVKRKHRRQDSEEGCLFCHGLDAIHYVFSGQPFDEIISSYTPVTGVKNDSSFTDDSNDVWASAYKTSLNDGVRTEHPSDSIDFSAIRKTSVGYQTHDASIINTSADGYCIKLTGPVEKPIKAGQVAAIQEKGGKWLLVVIRWLQMDDDASLTLGLELLSAKTIPCAVNPLMKTSKTTQFQRALLIAEQPPVINVSTLITPSLNFRKGLKFELLKEGKVSKGQLLDCVSNSPWFSQFQFRLFEDGI